MENLFGQLCEGCPRLKGADPEKTRTSSYRYPTRTWRSGKTVSTDFSAEYPLPVTFRGLSDKKVLPELKVTIDSAEDFPNRVVCSIEISGVKSLLAKFGIGECPAQFVSDNPPETQSE